MPEVPGKAPWFVPDSRYDAAYTFMKACELDPTPDAVEQTVQVFLKCLAIMCERGYEPDGATWQEAGRLGALADVRKKFSRLWNKAWKHGGTHDDSAYDLINYTGFYLRAHDDRWGEWGEPENPSEEQ
jgi:hypothetical protein